MASMVLVGGGIFVDVDRISVITQEELTNDPNGFTVKNVFYLSDVKSLNNVSGSHETLKDAQAEIMAVLDAKGVSEKLRQQLDKAIEPVVE